MKNVTALAALWFGAASLVLAADANKQSEKPTEAQIVAKARANYPLKTCVVSDEKIDDLGEATAYVHREPGKPERVIFVCCDGCIDDFKKEPAKYLAKLDEAEAAAKKKK